MSLYKKKKKILPFDPISEVSELAGMVLVDQTKFLSIFQTVQTPD